MTTDERSWVVLVGPGNGPTPDDQFATIFGNPDDAVAYRDRVGGRATVFVLAPMPDGSYYEWGVLHHGTCDQVLTYVNERAARACSRDACDELLRRRRGTTQWEPVTT